MDHFNLLKQLKSIVPDPRWSARVRADILAHEPKAVLPRLRPWSAVMNVLQSGSAIALTGALLFLLAGGFSLSRFFETAGGLDPQSLRAEAEAIDIQIQLADLSYDSPKMDTPAVAINPKAKPAFRATTSEITTSTPVAVATSTPEEPKEAEEPKEMTIDEALETLSEI